MRTILDFETRSTVDLRKSGAYLYSVHPSTRVTCTAWKERADRLHTLLPFEMMTLHWKLLPAHIQRDWMLSARQGVVVAHNAGFERAIYENVLVARQGWPAIDPSRWRCTAARAATCALPRALGDVGAVLQLTTQKDKGGMIAMQRTCKPTRDWNDWNKKGRHLGQPEPEQFISPDSHAHVFEELYRYCGQDVLTEELLDKKLPDLTDDEFAVWQFNLELNFRGYRVDEAAIRKIVAILESEEKVKLRELDELTMGLITKPGARASILEFLAVEGTVLPDIRANTVADALEGKKLSPIGRQLLELRKTLSKTSTRKYQAFLNRLHRDGRVRDNLLYHGASTGRDSGTGVQIQNFPRPVISIPKDRPYAPIKNIHECDPDTLKLLYGDNLSYLFSSVLRNMVIPSEGMELFVADYSKIEVAGGWWISDNEPGLKILRMGGDPYKHLASINTGKHYEEIDDEGEERQLAKHQILGCQYGMGWEKFQRTGRELHRLELSEAQSREAVSQYRQTFPKVQVFWRTIERAAIQAVNSKFRKVSFPYGAFIYERDYLWMVLPSGRKIAYHKPQIIWRANQYTHEEEQSLEFWGVNSRTKKWTLERTWGGVLMENMVQAVVRDLLMQAQLRLREVGYHGLFAVHDEIVAEAPVGQGTIEQFIRIICERPKWANEKLPIEAKGYKAERYRK